MMKACESCENVPWQLHVTWPDGAQFQVCEDCAFTGGTTRTKEVSIREAISQLRNWETVDAR